MSNDKTGPKISNSYGQGSKTDIRPNFELLIPMESKTYEPLYTQETCGLLYQIH
jgi:hypothetical protein